MSGRDPLADAIRALQPEPPDELLPAETLIAYARGQLAPAEREAVAEHLAGSPADADLLLAWREWNEDEAARPAPAEQDAAWSRFEARLAAESPEDPAPRETPVPRVRPPRAPTSVPARAWPAPPPVARPRWMPAALAAALLVATLSTTWALWERGRHERGLGGLGGLGIRANPAIVALAPDGAEPGDRSGTADVVQLSRRQREVSLVLTPPVEIDAARAYEGRLLSPSGRELWRGPLVPNERGTFTVGFEPPRLAAGLYKMRVDERRGTETREVASFSFEIMARDEAGGPR